MPPVDPATATRLEKVAVDNGFDQELPRAGAWLAFASSRAPLRLWLTTLDGPVIVAALSQRHVADALGDLGAPFDGAVPGDAAAARSVADMPSLHHLVRRAFQLSSPLPDELLHVFERRTGTLPRSTEAERLVVQRVGQDVFRQGLLQYWEGRCAVTGLAVVELLRASHIKPWARCETDAERLDVFNGLLLAPHLDAAFDGGFITVDDTGDVVVSASLGETDRRLLGLAEPLRLHSIAGRHRPYLRYHRDHRFETGRPPV